MGIIKDTIMAAAAAEQGRYHYERIPGRTNGREWRVGDAFDDPVTDFETEDEARDFVRKHNESLSRREIPRPESWRY